jgi:hypothetical protein
VIIVEIRARGSLEGQDKDVRFSSRASTLFPGSGVVSSSQLVMILSFKLQCTSCLGGSLTAPVLTESSPFSASQSISISDIPITFSQQGSNSSLHRPLSKHSPTAHSQWLPLAFHPPSLLIISPHEVLHHFSSVPHTPNRLQTNP